jgi:hypothetical protein
MAFIEIFSTTFLIYLAIIVLLIGGIFVYINYRISQQDHKISSMLGLISTMAQELDFFRNKLSIQNPYHLHGSGSVPIYESITQSKIDVSDDEEDDDDEDDEDDEDDDEDDEDDEEEEDEENYEEEEDDNETNIVIKKENEIINISDEIDDLSINDNLEDDIFFNNSATNADNHVFPIPITVLTTHKYASS